MTSELKFALSHPHREKRRGLGGARRVFGGLRGERFGLGLQTQDAVDVDGENDQANGD